MSAADVRELVKGALAMPAGATLNRSAEDQLQEAEKVCLGAQLTTPELIAADWMPQPEHYLVQGHAAIAAALRACGAKADIFPVCEELHRVDALDEAGGLEYIETLAQATPSRAAVQLQAGLVRKRAQVRREVALRSQAAALLRGSSETAAVLTEVRALLNQVDGATPDDAIAKPRMLAFDQLAPQRAPPRHWFRAGWLGAGVTLFPGKGGEGKSTLAQHEATCGSLGRAYFAGESAPYRSLLWNCEDEHDDVWRRQEQICEYEQIEMGSLVDRLFLVSRYGCDNALMLESHGALAPTRLLEELRQQLNDLAIDVLWLDNAAHLLVGNHDDRTHATQFINTLNGLVVGRPFGVVLLAHVSRAQGSEYTGTAAWENSARMRWYLGPKLPDQAFDVAEDTAPTDARYLCKRKSNYSARDYAKFSMRQGLMVPERVEGERMAGLMSAAEEQRAEQLCVAGFKTLADMGIKATDGKTSPDYLPSQMASKGLAHGFSKADLGRAMNRLMGRGTFVRGVVGKHANYTPKYGLKLTEGQS